ncbi:ABC transporter permease [Piscinibacter sp. XHJ-5]|uniref:ABC transporter permease n=1 Tax=Piscinibacter sp. XHJ-5 TaxID=3037797 RepID=UPI002452ADA4|nr:ABC transporter permease [Piscinibacter sp. XHJ-5]
MSAIAMPGMRDPVWRRRLAASALPLAAAAAVALFAWIQPAFLGADNLVGILRQVAIVGIMASAMTFVIMTGGIDLSIGPVLALSGLVAVLSLDAGLGLPIALALSLGLGLAIGLCSGGLIALGGLPPIIVTLAMLSIVRGSALLLGGPDLHAVRGQPAFSFIGTGSIAGLPFSVWLFGAVAATLVFVQRRSALGLRVTAIGDNERVAWLSGHRTRQTTMSLYGLSGLCAALAGVILASQVHTGSATYGEFGTELDVIAAVVLGGTQLSGGRGSVARTVLGVLFLGALNNAMNILDVPIDLQLIAKGVIIATALGLGRLRS